MVNFDITGEVYFFVAILCADFESYLKILIKPFWHPTMFFLSRNAKAQAFDNK